MRDVSQRALGAAIGMTKKNGSTRINRYEQQTSRADMDTAAELAEALDVPLAYLFADNEELAEWILAFGKLDPETRAKMIAKAKKTKG